MNKAQHVCRCCGKAFLSSGCIVCKKCKRKIARIVHWRKIRQYPFCFWKWNKVTVKEVDEIIEELRNKEQKK